MESYIILMAQRLLSDEIINLRAPEPADLDLMFIWENDSSLWHIGNAVAPYSHKQLWDYIENYDADIFSSRQLRFIVEENASGMAVGTIDVFDFDPVNRHASLGILIDEPYRGQGIARRAVNLLCEYCAVHIGIHSLTAISDKENIPGQNTFKSCGFSTSGCLRSWIRCGNTYHDAVIMQKLF